MAKLEADVNINFKNDFVIGHVETGNALPTAGTAYTAGDLLTIDPITNALTHSDGLNFHVISVEDVSAEQADKHLSDGTLIPVYVKGEFSAYEVTLNGVKLTPEQRTKAMGRALAGTNINLRLPHGVE